MPEQPPPPQSPLLNRLDAIKENTFIPEDFKSKKELDKYYGEQNRKERLKNVINWIFIVFVCIISLVATIVIGMRLLHLVLSLERQWMTPEQLQNIDKLFFSGAIGGLLVTYLKKIND